MDRRDFIYQAGGAITALTLPFFYISCGPSEYTERLADPVWLREITDVETLMQIGRHYLLQYPDENREAYLLETLTPVLDKDEGRWEAVLKDHIQTEFKEGKVVLAAGWVLSRTEARQCALLSLLSSQ